MSTSNNSSLNSEQTPIRLDRSRIKKAAWWLVVLEDEDVAVKDQVAFKHWCESHAENALAYQHVSRAISRFDQAGFNASDVGVANQVIQSEVLSTDSYLKPIAATSFGFLLMATAWLYQSGYSVDYLASDYKSNVGEVTEVQLADGSRLVLDSMSAVNIYYSSDKRRIELVQGQLFADVVTNPQRPFTVETQSSTTTALGTSFTVSQQDENTHVTISESNVELCHRNPLNTSLHQLPCVRGSQGEQMRLQERQLYGPEAINVAKDIAWMKHRLVIDNQPLSQVLDQLDKYNAGLLIYLESEVESIRVSGVFPTDDIELSFSMLAKHPQVEMTSLSQAVNIFRKK